MTRPLFHLALDVADLERSVDFYRRLFGVEPGRHEPDYARFEPGEPAVVLSLDRSPAPRDGGGPNHLGIRLPDAAALEAARQRVRAAGLETEAELGVECCYARQDKHWLVDPDGNPWELYVVTEADLARHGRPAAGESACSTPECCS